MDIIETIRYLNSADGPNIPLRTLGAYCGLSGSSLCRYLNNKQHAREDIRKQMEKGIKELMLEIVGECRWLM